MSDPEGRFVRFRHHVRRHRLAVIALACAAVVLIEIGATSGFFGWLIALGAAPSPPPDLNPYHEQILAISSNITYFGEVQYYFPSLNRTSLCHPSCPELPRTWISTDSKYPDEIGVLFYYNVTNEVGVDVNLSQPLIRTSGPDPTLFYLITYCCYTTLDQKYSEPLDAELQFTPHAQIGLEGYAYTTEALPRSADGGYTLYVNFTSN